jgi:putative membrane protein
VDLAPGKSISPEDRAKVSSIGLKVLAHVSEAQKDIQAKNVDAAKKELAQAVTLVKLLKDVLPTVKVIDHIWVTKTNLSYLNTTEVQQDLVSIVASIDQLYVVLPVGKAKEHAKRAKDILTKEKQKGASKAKEELEAAEEALDFNEVDLSVSYTSRLVKVAQSDLEKGKTKEANAALNSVADGLLFFDTTVINPAEMAARNVWIAGQDFAAKDDKAAKTRLKMAKTALQDVAKSSDKTLHERAVALITKMDAVNTGADLDAAWPETRKLVEQWQTAGMKQLDSKDKGDKEAKIANERFLRAADQDSLTDIRLGTVAQKHAASDAVKKYGERAVRDHSSMNKELRVITSKNGIKLAEGLDQKHQELIKGLSELKGSEFDRAYTKDMVSGHEKAIEQFEIEVKNGRDSDVQAWAQKWLPTLREHLKLARETVKDVNGK